MKRLLLRVRHFFYRKAQKELEMGVYDCHYFLGGLFFHVGKLRGIKPKLHPHQMAILAHVRQSDHLRLMVVKGMGKAGAQFFNKEGDDNEADL